MARPSMLARVAGASALLILSAAPSTALPTMIRLGYSDCASCHLSPQGGGLLNAYGRGIDQAQSLRGGEYQPPDEGASPRLFGRRVTQDLRAVLQFQSMQVTDQPVTTLFRPRMMYRNVTELGSRFSLSATITGETQGAPRPALAYDPGTRASAAFVNTALVHFRAGSAVEIAAGRDQLPTGINVPDLTAFIKSRNRLGYYDAPTQIKLYWGGARYHVTPFGYVGAENEPAGDRESGGGALAEFDVVGKQRTIVGVTLQQGSARNGDRRTVGGYVRLGFGSWGVLAEHDRSARTRAAAVSTTSFDQQTSYAQLFWAAREWLVVSGIAESLRVQQPFAERLTAGKVEVSARLRSEATIGITARVQRDLLTGRLARSFAIQAAFKTVR